MNSSRDHSTYLIAIARVIKERGIKGEVAALPLLAHVQFLRPHLDVCVRFPSGDTQTMKLRSVKRDRNAVLVTFYGIYTREEAKTLRNVTIEIDSSHLPELQRDEYYHHQIIGLSVFTVDGKELGKVTGVIETGGNDVYSVGNKEREYLIPAVKEIITNIDLDAGTMIIRPIDGLLD